MDPKEYTQEILDRTFVMVLCRNDRYTGKPHFWRIDDLHNHYWCIPTKFTLQEARDGFPGDPKAEQRPFSKTALEKLRRLKPGAKVRMNNDVHEYNCWWALRLDQDDSLEAQIKAKEVDLVVVRTLIKRAAGNLMKQERSLVKELKALKEKQLI